MGVINLQHRQHHVYRPREIRMISTIGFLVGAEIEMARLEEANSTLAENCKPARSSSAPKAFCSAISA
jgi:GAF domain-containing protein